MEHESQEFFTEHEHDEVNGFTILAAEKGRYHIAEKWDASEADDVSTEGMRWMDYWVPESDLLARKEDEKCEPAGTLTDEQFAGVCENVGQEKYVE